MFKHVIQIKNFEISTWKLNCSNFIRKLLKLIKTLHNYLIVMLLIIVMIHYDLSQVIH